MENPTEDFFFFLLVAVFSVPLRQAVCVRFVSLFRLVSFLCLTPLTPLNALVPVQVADLKLASGLLPECKVQNEAFPRSLLHPFLLLHPLIVPRRPFGPGATANRSFINLPIQVRQQNREKIKGSGRFFLPISVLVACFGQARA